MRTAVVAASEHPVAAHAVGEVAGAVIEVLGSPVDLVWATVTGPFAGAAADISSALGTLLSPTVSVTTVTGGFLAGSRVVADAPGIALLAVHGVAAHPLRVPAGGSPGATLRDDTRHDGAPGTAVLVADPFTIRPDDILEPPSTSGGLDLVAGFAASATSPGRNALLLDGRVHHDGAVGVFLPASVDTGTVVAHGWHPLGRELDLVVGDDLTLRSPHGEDPTRHVLEVLLSAGVVPVDGVSWALLTERGDVLPAPAAGAAGVPAPPSARAGDRLAVRLATTDPRTAAEKFSGSLARSTPGPMGAVLAMVGGRRPTALHGAPWGDATTLCDAARGNSLGIVCGAVLGVSGGRVAHTEDAAVALTLDAEADAGALPPRSGDGRHPGGR